MARAEWNQEVEALPAQSPAQAFAAGIRRRRPDRRAENFHPELCDRLIQLFGKDAVPVVDH